MALAILMFTVIHPRDPVLFGLFDQQTIDGSNYMYM